MFDKTEAQPDKGGIKLGASGKIGVYPALEGCISSYGVVSLSWVVLYIKTTSAWVELGFP